VYSPTGCARPQRSLGNEDARRSSRSFAGVTSRAGFSDHNLLVPIVSTKLLGAGESIFGALRIALSKFSSVIHFDTSFVDSSACAGDHFTFEA
jgi:hypothetical protein